MDDVTMSWKFIIKLRKEVKGLSPLSRALPDLLAVAAVEFGGRTVRRVFCGGWESKSSASNREPKMFGEKSVENRLGRGPRACWVSPEPT